MRTPTPTNECRTGMIRKPDEKGGLEIDERQQQADDREDGGVSHEIGVEFKPGISLFPKDFMSEGREFHAQKDRETMPH